VLNIPIKTIGLHKVPVELHAEVEAAITVNVARNADEAERQARGEDLTVARTEEEEAQAQARVDAGKFFEAPPAEAAEGEQKAEGEKKAAGEKRTEPASAEPVAKPAKKAKKE